MSPALAGRFFTIGPPGKPVYCKLLIDPIWVMGLPLDPYTLGAVTRWMGMKVEKAKKKKNCSLLNTFCLFLKSSLCMKNSGLFSQVQIYLKYLNLLFLPPSLPFFLPSLSSFFPILLPSSLPSIQATLKFQSTLLHVEIQFKWTTETQTQSKQQFFYQSFFSFVCSTKSLNICEESSYLITK